MGAYRTDKAEPYVLPCVHEAESRIFHGQPGHEYSGIDGIPSYRKNCMDLAYGAESDVVKGDRVVAAQSLSGTGSLRVGLEFLKAWFPNKDAKVWVADPTWPTHRGIAEKAGFEW